MKEIGNCSGDATRSVGVSAFEIEILNDGLIVGEGKKTVTISRGISGTYVSIKESGTLISRTEKDSVDYAVFVTGSVQIEGGTVEAEGGRGAFGFEAQAVSLSYADARIWYGDNKAIANVSGPKDVNELSSNDSQRYVCIGK